MTKQELLKTLDLVCLDENELLLFNYRKLDRKTMVWAVKHLSECQNCALIASELSELEIREILKETLFENYVNQIVKSYFNTLKEAKYSSSSV